MQINKCQKNSHKTLCCSIGRSWLILIVLFALPGCSGFVSIDGKFSGPQLSRDIHVVQKSETLFSLAWRYGWDYKKLASANSIKAPFIIYPGQKLNVAHPNVGFTSGRVSAGKKLTKTTKANTTGSPSAYKNGSRATKTRITGGALPWTWPAKGRVIAKFSSKTPVNKGIDIAGKLGESVMAAAAGSVVYAGSGLLGYGNLVIIKHNEQYLSAYAHNKRLLVKENQKVKAGQPIAEIGSSGTDKVKLHFEIRSQGKPVNPGLYLPKMR